MALPLKHRAERRRERFSPRSTLHMHAPARFQTSRVFHVCRSTSPLFFKLALQYRFRLSNFFVVSSLFRDF